MVSGHQPGKKAQLIWGLALIAMGVAVFFQIPQKVPKLVEMGQSNATILFLRICFYVVGFILVGGGAKKVMRYFKPDEKVNGHPKTEIDDF